MIYKFGTLIENNDVEYKYGNLFRHEVHPTWSRVKIAPNEKQIPLMLDIAKRWEGPYGILYVLKLSHMGYPAARYQSPVPCSFDELELFAYSFQKFFEGDGRHHLWFMDVKSRSQLVYDNHNLIYSYGDDEGVIGLLESKGFTAGNPRIPKPHSHHYNSEFANMEEEVMKYFEWKEFPLQDEHDDP